MMHNSPSCIHMFKVHLWLFNKCLMLHLNDFRKCVKTFSKLFYRHSLSSHRSKPDLACFLFVLFFVFQILSLSALLHTSVSVPACERLSWKCKLSSQHALALVALFWFLCPPRLPSFRLFSLPSPFLPLPPF